MVRKRKRNSSNLNEKTPISLSLKRKSYENIIHVYLTVKVGEYMVDFLIDSGSTCTKVSLEMVQIWGLQNFIDKSDGDYKEQVLGRLRIPFDFQEKNLRLFPYIQVIEKSKMNEPIIGLDILSHHYCTLMLESSNPRLLLRPCLQLPQRTKLCYNTCTLNKQIRWCMVDTGTTFTAVAESTLSLVACRVVEKEEHHETLDGSFKTTKKKVQNVEMSIRSIVRKIDITLDNSLSCVLIGMNALEKTRLDFRLDDIPMISSLCK